MEDERNKILALIEDKENYDFKTVYSGWGWFLFTVIGMSATPTRVDFINRKTGNVEASTTDHEILKKFVGR